MKRYRLLKDTLLLPAGTKCHISAKGNLVHGSSVLVRKRQIEEQPSILKEWFEEIPEKPKTVWDLKNGDKCWSIFYSLSTGFYMEETMFDRRCESLRNIGEIFLTKEDAERELVRRKAKVVLERDAEGFKPDWDNDQEKFTVYYYKMTKRLEVWCELDYNFGLIYFATEEDAKESIRKHPQEWKIYLGVEE